MTEPTSFLENEFLKLGIETNGCITSLVNKKSGTEFLASDAPSGWKLITSMGEWREHQVFDHANAGKVTLEGDRAEIRFEELTGEEQARLDITLTLTMTLQDEEIEARATVENRSHETVREIWFPFLSGFRKISAQASDHLALPMTIGAVLDEPAKNLPFGKYVNQGGGRFFAYESWPHYPLPYPGVASMPWMDFYNEEEGLYLGSHDSHSPTTALLARGRPEQSDFQLGIGRYPFVAPGETWASAAFVLRPHGGDWHAGARRYREFAAARGTGTASPDWARRLAGVQGMFHIEQNKHIVHPYSRLVDVFRANARRGINLPLFVFSWFAAGHDSDYPEYEASPKLGGRDALRQAIRTVKAEGGRVILYTQGRLIDKQTEYYRRLGARICLKNEDGVEYIDEYSFNHGGTVYPGKIFALACPSTEEWYETLRGQIDLVMALGADGILFDQIAGEPPFLCFDKSHPHAKPDMAFDGKVRLLKRLQEYAARRDPEFIIMGELACDAFLSELDLSHGYSTHPAPDQTRLRFFPELYTYTFPAHRITSRGAATIPALNYVFAAGLLLECFQPLPPKEAAYLDALIKLRVRLSRFFAEGTFLDTDGVRVEGEGLAAKAFLAKDGEERMLVAYQRDGQACRAKLTVDGKSDTWEIIGPDGESTKRTTPAGKPMEFEIPAEELRVVLVR
ncbi:MAG: hypothetical protein JW748_11110 [Anaerolineales bacterium]|nr:hypothetical protein [Anaerolineales bacterium]